VLGYNIKRMHRFGYVVYYLEWIGDYPFLLCIEICIGKLFRLSENVYLFNTRRCLTISDYNINEQIRDREVRVIGSKGEQLGILTSKEAQRIATEEGLDLVKVAPKAKPPVCKIIDFGKFKYEQTKREKEAKKKQNVISVKEVRLSPNIEQHDINTKMKNANKFLTKGDKVKVSVRFRGRELAHTSAGRTVLLQFAKDLSEIADIEKYPKMEGRSMTMFLTPKKTK